MKGMTKKLFEDWITSLIGLSIMIITSYKTYIDFDILTISKTVVIVILMTLGMLLLKSKDAILYRVFKSKLK